MRASGIDLVDIGLVLTRQCLQFAGQLGGGLDVLDKVLRGRININPALNAPAKIPRSRSAQVLVGLKVFSAGVVACWPLSDGLHVFEDVRSAFLRFGLLLGQLFQNRTPLRIAQGFPFFAQLFNRALEVDRRIAGFLGVVAEQQKTGRDGTGQQCQTGRATEHA